MLARSTNRATDDSITTKTEVGQRYTKCTGHRLAGCSIAYGPADSLRFTIC